MDTKRQPIMVGTRFVYLNAKDIKSISLDCKQELKALEEIAKVSPLLAPANETVSRWRYDIDYIKTVILSATPRWLREMLANPVMAEYVQELYNIDISKDNKKLDDQQKTGLINLDLKFRTSETHWQDELVYISNIVESYIDDVLPILIDIPQEVKVVYSDDEWTIEYIPLSKSIILI